MIVARKIRNLEELKVLSSFLTKEDITDKSEEDSIIYVLEENNNIIGASKMIRINDYGLLSFLVITKERRLEKLGDSLLRSILNYGLLNGIEVVYSTYHGYLVKEGFRSIDLDKVPKVLKSRLNYEALECNVSDFFRKGCKS